MEKLINLLFDIRGDSLGQDKINQFEQQYSVTLPNEYKEFLIYCDGGVLNELSVGFSLSLQAITRGTKCEFIVYNFLPLLEYKWGISSVVEEIKTMQDWLINDFNISYDYTKDFVPIAMTGGDLRICIGCKSEYIGKIYLFDPYAQYPNSINNMFWLLADSLQEFITTRLQPCDDKTFVAISNVNKI